MVKQHSRDGELVDEQGRLDDCYELLESHLERMADNRALVAHAGVQGAIREQREARRSAIEDALYSHDLLYFGRLDFEEGKGQDGESCRYIGRVGLLDDDGECLVVNWKSDAAMPYFRASKGENLGIARRRALAGRERILTGLSDELLGHLPPHLDAGELWTTPQDLLLAELERSRDGQMRDIVATIQEEQDRLIRADLDRALIVQGGPGTGKTAIGLHRASYLLHQTANRVAEDSILVVAPNDVFLRYISMVLPGLGNIAVRHATVNSLGPRLVTQRSEIPASAAVKGDKRMAQLISNYLESRIGLEPRTEAFELGRGQYRISVDQVNALISRARNSARTFNAGRQAFRSSILSDIARRYGRKSAELRRELSSDTALERLVNRSWPTISPQQVIADLLTGPRRLAASGAALLTETERDAILLDPIERLEDMPWSAMDVALVDEAAWQLDGTNRTYEHLIIDEAQDLSPMQLRMLARRCPSRSMTVLGDLAQATSPWAARSWSEVAGSLGLEDPDIQSLTVGYRVPVEVIDEANQLLAQIDVDVPETRSVRSVGTPPQHDELDHDDLTSELVSRLRASMFEDHSTGVVVPEELYEQVRIALIEGNIKFGEASRRDLVHRITLVSFDLVKGLEFDHVIVVDGGVLSRGLQVDLRLRYVAITRAVQELSIIDIPRPEATAQRPSLTTTEYEMPSLEGVTHEVPAIRFEQDGVTLYIAALPARVIADIGVTDTWDPTLPEDSSDQGYQREVIASHAKKIARFLLDPAHSRLMPTAATLCARRPLTFEAYSHNGEEQAFGTLHVTKPIYIVDGQHRTAGFSLAVEDDDEIAAFHRPVVIMEAVPKLEEVRQFQTINATAKRVKTDLADRLLKQLGEFDQPGRTWMATALEVADLLNETPGGVWRGGIRMPNQAGGIASQKTITESLKLVLNGVLRGSDARTFAGAINNYWEALRRLMPEAFHEPKHYVVQKTVGVFALHEVAAEVFLRCYADGKNFQSDRMLHMLKETGEYVDPSFWLNRAHGGTAPMYGGRAGFTALAQEMIAALPSHEAASGPGITL